MKKFYLWIWLMLLGAIVIAQPLGTSSKKALRYYESGRVARNQGNQGKALEDFLLALKAAPEFNEVHLDIADIYLAYNSFDEAINHYEAFLKNAPDNQRMESWRDHAKQGMAIANFRKTSLSNPVAFEPKNLGSAINSRDDEYLPALTVDGQTLIFTRRFPSNEQTVHYAPFEEDFYISTLENGQWQKAKRMSEPVNSHDNEGAQCISQDGRIMFFTACGRNDGAGRCDLYMCTRKGEKWSKPRNLGPAVNTNMWESQPSFSIDGRTLYFASDRRGGYGGMDIYKTTYKDGKWTAPENLGPTINTEGNEMSPFIHYNDRTLYFASDGHIGMGGMDLFKTELDSLGQWTTPVNLGYPINTAGNESSLIVAADGKTALYASDQLQGYGKQDLFQFTLPEAVQAIPVTYQKGVTFDKKTLQKISASVKVIDIETGIEVAAITSDGSDGSFMVSLPANATYALHVTAKGYLFYSENFDFRYGLGEVPQTLQVPLSPIEVGEEITLRNIFFETAKYELLPTSNAELQTVVNLMKNNPEIHIELAGHTDNVGKSDYNQTLSENRAKAVYEYLVNQGVDANRLSFRGYGSTRPVASNDTEEGRAQNRRTTLEIIE
ncbi:MAG: OmpA family protein [Bacteroidales bacterium]|nr:OmpA family protein [Bacteroidales bacterium]